MEQAKSVLETARHALSTSGGSTSSLLDLSQRIEAIEDQTLSLVQLHQRILAQKMVHEFTVINFVFLIGIE